jgi:hypothetical protein
MKNRKHMQNESNNARKKRRKNLLRNFSNSHKKGAYIEKVSFSLLFVSPKSQIYGTVFSEEEDIPFLSVRSIHTNLSNERCYTKLETRERYYKSEGVDNERTANFLIY